MDKIFYTPKNAWVGDFIPYNEEGEYKLFYLKRSTYYMFYCQFPKNLQVVCHATSTNLYSWEPIHEDTFTADDNIYELSDWRDPFVFWNDEAQEYWMLLAARVKDPSNRKGCTALCTSKDLTSWKIFKPPYAPCFHESAHESPILTKL